MVQNVYCRINDSPNRGLEISSTHCTVITYRYRQFLLRSRYSNIAHTLCQCVSFIWCQHQRHSIENVLLLIIFGWWWWWVLCACAVIVCMMLSFVLCVWCKIEIRVFFFFFEIPSIHLEPIARGKAFGNAHSITL